jgi:hypothetical protein
MSTQRSLLLFNLKHDLKMLIDALDKCDENSPYDLFNEVITNLKGQFRGNLTGEMIKSLIDNHVKDPQVSSEVLDFIEYIYHDFLNLTSDKIPWGEKLGNNFLFGDLDDKQEWCLNDEQKKLILCNLEMSKLTPSEKKYFESVISSDKTISELNLILFYFKDIPYTYTKCPNGCSLEA